MYECDTCTRRFHAWFSCEQHMDDTGHRHTTYSCQTCSKTFLSWNAVESHMDAKGHYRSLPVSTMGGWPVTPTTVLEPNPPAIAAQPTHAECYLNSVSDSIVRSVLSQPLSSLLIIFLVCSTKRRTRILQLLFRMSYSLHTNLFYAYKVCTSHL